MTEEKKEWVDRKLTKEEFHKITKGSMEINNPVFEGLYRLYLLSTQEISDIHRTLAKRLKSNTDLLIWNKTAYPVEFTQELAYGKGIFFKASGATIFDGPYADATDVDETQLKKNVATVYLNAKLEGFQVDIYSGFAIRKISDTLGDYWAPHYWVADKKNNAVYESGSVSKECFGLKINAKQFLKDTLDFDYYSLAD